MTGPDLSDLFGGSARSDTAAAELQAMIPPKHAPPAKQQDQADEEPTAATPAKKTAAKKATPEPAKQQSQADEEPTAATPAKKTAVRRKVPPKPTRTEPASAEAEEATATSVYIHPDAKTKIRKLRDGRTNAEIALGAIDAVHERLAELVDAHHTQAPPGGEGSLFPGRRTTTGRRRGGPRRVLWTIQITPAETAVIDRLMTETGAASRSELVAVAVEAHLGITS